MLARLILVYLLAYLIFCKLNVPHGDKMPKKVIERRTIRHKTHAKLRVRAVGLEEERVERLWHPKQPIKSIALKIEPVKNGNNPRLTNELID